MADTVSTTIIQNGYRNIVVAFTNESDGTGESGVLKLDATSAATTGNFSVSKAGQVFWPNTHWTIWRIEYDVRAMGLRIQWVANTPQDMVILGGGGAGQTKFSEFGGLTVPNIAGATGSIQFTTTGAMPSSSYYVVLHLKKNIPVS